MEIYKKFKQLSLKEQNTNNTEHNTKLKRSIYVYTVNVIKRIQK